ncbi:hypothetical protein GCM10007940_30540 [Portibacter lacus]|uniref:Uncharacterized protein n=2 Tax=Portibacter lacus TaxID=1099794 RepID=A0AA37SUK9_9BACT|nr:hypothetical protein GCM10007940_30540 [Portibacter lacus]
MFNIYNLILEQNSNINSLDNILIIIKINTMLKKLSKTDVIMLFLAFSTLILSEIMWFNGETDGALFLGLWVPSILAFAIYLKLIKIDNK